MPLAGVIIETPALDPIGLPIVNVIDYEINREINAAGAWSVNFTASEQVAAQIKTRWRLSIVEEGRPGYLLRRGIILEHSYRISSDGSATVSLQGMTRLYALMDQSTHQGLAYDGTDDIEAIANDLTGETVTAPADASERTPKVTFNDTSKLAALFTACELARYNIRETFDEDGFELVSQDDVPDSGFTFVNVEQAGPELENAAADGMGLISGAPVIGYSGKNLANRIIPIGVDYDGKEMGLEASDGAEPYEIRTGTHPNSLTYKYIQDDESFDTFGLVELQYVRSDVKNPSDDAGTRLAAANVLYALSASEMMKRKSEVISFGSAIANGYQVDALPGDRVRVRFRGTVLLMSGVFTYRDVDQDFLVIKRRDASTLAGVRDVAFTLTAPEVPLLAVNLPGAVPIPPPPTPPPDPPRQDDPNEDDNTPADEGPPGDFPTDMPQVPEIPFLPPDLQTPPEGIPPGKPYQPCCADPSTDVNDGGFIPQAKGSGQDGLAPFAYSVSGDSDPFDPDLVDILLPNNALPDPLLAVIFTFGLSYATVSTMSIAPGAGTSKITVGKTDPVGVSYVHYIAMAPGAPVYFYADYNWTGVGVDIGPSLGVLQSDGDINWGGGSPGPEYATTLRSAHT